MPVESIVRSNPQAHADVEYRKRVLQIAKGLSATLGTDFFNSVVKHMVTAFHVDCGFLAELTGTPPDRIRTLAVYRKRRRSEDFEQKRPGTASGQVLTDGWFACSKDATRVFPDDTLLQEMQAEGYAGIRLSSSSGQPIGVLAVISKAILTDVQLMKSVLIAFAPRAAGELERKRADDIHRENEERYHAFIASNPDAMWRFEFSQPIPLDVDEDEQIALISRFGYLAECNDALARQFGLESADEVIGHSFEAIAPRININVREELRAAIRSKFRNTFVETTPVDSTGRCFYRMRSQLGIVEHGHLRRIWGTTKDITELRRAELSMVAAERLFRHVLEEIKLPAVLLDQSGAVTFCNEYFLGLIGRSREELSSLTWMDQVVPAKETQRWKAMLSPSGLSKQSSAHFKGVILASNGVRKEILWSTIMVRDQDGEMAGLAAIGRDVAYQEALEKEAQQAQKLQSIGHVAVSIAYGFNSFLAIVLENVSEMLRRPTEDKQAFANLCAIQDSITLCVKLTGQLLAFGCKQELQPKSIALNDLIANGEGFIRSLIGKGISLVFDLASPLWPVYADPVQIQQALANLVTNAREAMPLGGGLTITTSNLVIGPHDTAYTGVKSGPYVRVSVSDNGVGMTEEVKMHMFEPFFTTKTDGSGFGLAAVYGIVTQSGGHITVHSDFRKGTTMNVLLPASIIAPHE